jgi:hypothetical protein
MILFLAFIFGGLYMIYYALESFQTEIEQEFVYNGAQNVRLKYVNSSIKFLDLNKVKLRKDNHLYKTLRYNKKNIFKSHKAVKCNFDE